MTTPGRRPRAHQHPRRETMKTARKSSLAAAVAAVLVLAGCSGSDDAAEASADDINEVDELESAEGIIEAPMLADFVDAGDLPPVADRMPTVEDIMVEPVYEDIGNHGGSWNMA